jgi:prevent-host-death family protein
MTKEPLMTTTSINIVDAKHEFSELINRVAHNKERIVLTRRGKDIAAIVPLEDLEKLLSKQDKSDLEEAVESLKDMREHGIITIEQLKNDIG